MAADREPSAPALAPPPDDDAPEGAPDWVVTFADLATLLLCFFVLLLSFSRMDQERFKEVAGSLKEAFGVQRTTPAFDIPRGIDLIARDFNAQFAADLVEQLRSTIKQAGGQGAGVSVEETARGLLIDIPGAILFEPAATELRDEGRALLAALAPLLHEIGGEIHVEGHTDDTPFGAAPGVLDGNWLLSFQRALGVLAVLADAGGIALERLAPIGRGASVPVASNDTEAGRRRNRRVEILLLRDPADGPLDPALAAPADAAGAAKRGGAPARPAPGIEPELHVPEASFSPTEQTAEQGPSGPVSLFPDGW